MKKAREGSVVGLRIKGKRDEVAVATGMLSYRGQTAKARGTG